MATASTCTSVDVTYTINYITALDDPVRKQSGEVNISTRSGLLFSGHIEKQINIESLRWISKCKYIGFPLQPHYCLVVSFLDPGTRLVENIFFETADEREDAFDACLKHMKDLLLIKCQGCDSDRNKGNDFTDLVSVICNQPIHAGKVKMTVDSDVKMQTSEGVKLDFLMLIDLECVCLYRGELMKPVHQLMFWEAESEISIERVELTHKSRPEGLSEKIVYLQTKTQSFALYNADSEVIKQLQNLIPKKKFLMTDPQLMLEVMPRLKLPQLLSPSASWDTDCKAVATTSDHPWTEESNIAVRIHDALCEVEDSFQANEDIQNMWVAIEFDIQEIIDGGTAPTTDIRSGGMDADSGEHLQSALSDVEDQLRENNLPVAISRIRACREIFESSNVWAIHQIFTRSDAKLMKALYLKTLCE